MCAAAGCDRPPGPPIATPDTPYETQRHREAFELSTEGSLIVSNPMGDLRIRSAKGGEPLLAAVVQRLRGERRPVKFSVESDGTTATIAVSAARDFDGRVDAVVLMPPGAHIDAEVTYGLLEVRVKSRGVVARTSGGDIRVRTDGPVEARTRGGDIAFSLHDAANWQAPSSLESHAGEISIFTPVTADVAVDLAARKIDRQLPDGADVELEATPTTLRGQLNAGKLRLRARAPDGTIRLIGT